MRDYEFNLTYILPEHAPDGMSHMDALHDEGCNDALIGTGCAGRMSMHFVRQAACLYVALASAMDDVERAIPGAACVSLQLMKNQDAAL